MKLPISRFSVHGKSMNPILKEGQDVLVSSWLYKPKVGDIVVIKKNGKEMIKRIQTIRDRDIFVIGDNVSESTDSRHFGPIEKAQIVGKIIFR